MPDERYDATTWPKEERAEAFSLIARQFYRQNFGRMGKADLEVLLFSIYIEHLLNNDLPYDDYTLALQLGIPESRVRSLKVKKELQYHHADYDWKRAFAERIPYAKYDDKKALVKVSIPDPNVRRDVEHYIDSQNWYSEYQLNSKLLQMRPDQFVALCMALYAELSEDPGTTPKEQAAIERRLQESGSSAWADDETQGLLRTIKEKGLKNCWKEVLKGTGKAGFKAVMAAIPFGDSIQVLVEAMLGKM